MSNFDVDKFRGILSICIGSESQISFAERCGISKEHLSRMLRAKTPSRPSKTTLKKIADASGGVVTFDDLLEVCGYIESPSLAGRTLRIKEKAETVVSEMKTGFSEMTKSCRVFPSIYEFIQEHEMLYSTETLSNIYVSPGKEYDGNAHYGAEYISYAKVTFEDIFYYCDLWFAIYYAETIGGKVIVLDACIDGASVVEAGAISQSAIDELAADGEDVNTLPYVVNYRRKKDVKSAEQRLLDIIFGDCKPTDQYYYRSIIGTGFYIDDVSDDKFRAFLKTHKNVFLSDEGKARECYKKALDSDKPKEAFAECFDAAFFTEGFGAAISHVMKEETDYDFIYYDFSDEYEKNRPCVMLPEDDPMYESDDLKSVCERYARELGLKSYGMCSVLIRHEMMESDIVEINYEED